MERNLFAYEVYYSGRIRDSRVTVPIADVLKKIVKFIIVR